MNTLDNSCMESSINNNLLSSYDFINCSSKNIYSPIDFGLKESNSNADILKEIELSKVKKTTTTPQLERQNKKSDKNKLLGEWVGIVEEVNEQSFVAKLRDTLNNVHTKELAEFSKDDLLDKEIGYLAEGAIFYWTISYKTIDNTKYKVSNINFRKSLPISEALKEKAKEESQQLVSFLSQF